MIRGIKSKIQWQSEETKEIPCKTRQSIKNKAFNQKGANKGECEFPTRKRTWSQVHNAREEPDMTREERIEKIKLQNVLNGKVFTMDILIKFGMATLVDVVTIQEWSHLFEPPAPYLHELEVRGSY